MRRKPADTATPPTDDRSVEDLLAEFDAVTAKPDAVTGDNLSSDQVGQETAAPDFDQQLQDLLGPDPRISELQGQVDSLRAQEIERQSRQDFEGFSRKLQAELGPNVDEQFARTNLLAMAAERPELEAVWRYRHLTDADRRAADAEFRQLEVLYHRAQQAPDDPRTRNYTDGFKVGRLLGLQHLFKDGVARSVSRQNAASASVLFQ